jgi:hypothetical protein
MAAIRSSSPSSPKTSKSACVKPVNPEEVVCVVIVKISPRQMNH